jgi:hypothetical protein
MPDIQFAASAEMSLYVTTSRATPGVTDPLKKVTDTISTDERWPELDANKSPLSSAEAENTRG